MALIDITPIMTSNATPAPYAVSASSEYDSRFQAWKAFNNSLIDNLDSFGTSGTTGWISIDFSVQTKIDAISIFARNFNEPAICFRNAILYGSNDNINFEEILVINNQMYWKMQESRLFKLQNQVNFRYYRFNIISNNGGTWTNIGLIKFFQEDNKEEKVNYKNLPYFNYMIPKATTNKLKSIVNDSREGLLIMSNDPDNYGTLHVINKYGNTEIIKTELTNISILFEGVAAIEKIDYTLKEAYTNYKYLIMYAQPVANGKETISLILDTKVITDNLNNEHAFIIQMYHTSTYFFNIRLYFKSDNVFTISQIGKSDGWKDCRINRIIGIK